jgi:carbonic anhydrase
MTSALTRRRLVRSRAAVAVGGPVAALVAGCGGGDSAATTSTTAGPRPRSPKEALERLLAGNERFGSGQALNANRDDLRRAEIAEEQKPFAAILGCSDSRVPPDVVFDQGHGRSVRRSHRGQHRDRAGCGRQHRVRGRAPRKRPGDGARPREVRCRHRRRAAATEGAHEPGSIDAFVDPIVPVVKRTRRRSPNASDKALTERSIRANVKHSVEELTNSETLLSHLVEDGKLMIVGAEYELHSGKVPVL